MNEKSSTPIEERVKRGQSVALGDTGNGGADVPSHAQGISNRAGDVESVVGAAPGDGDAIEIIDETDDDAEDDDEAEDELDEDEEEEDDVDDPAAEPGKPI